MDNDSKIINLIIRLFFLSLLFFSGFTLIRPFISVILWGGIIAIAWFPIFLWLKGVLGGKPKLASILLTIAGIAIILGPVSAIAAILAGNLRFLAEHLSDGGKLVPPPPANIADWPIVGEKLSSAWELASANLGEFSSRFKPQLEELGKTSLSLATNTSLTVLKFIASIVIAGVFTIKAEGITGGLKRLAEKLAPGRGTAFAALSASTVRNVSRGIIGVAVIQSLLIGIGLVLAGIPAAGVLTLLCLILGIIQIGPGIVVIGSLIFAWSTLSKTTALLLTLWMIPATLVDNFLKPLLMARGLPVPMIVIIIGVFGGVITYGIIGLFLGPVILSLCYELIKAWLEQKLSDTNSFPDEI